MRVHLLAWLILSCFLQAVSAAPRPAPRVWSVDLGAGWQSAIMLLPPDAAGTRVGHFFWLVESREIHWLEDDQTITLVYERPWEEKHPGAPRVRFRKEGTSLVLQREGLSEVESAELAGKEWMQGGPEPGQLDSFHDRNSPYSRHHDRGELTLDVATVPAPLARHALRVFGDDLKVLPKWLEHPELPAEALEGAFEAAADPDGFPPKKTEGWKSVIHRALALNPTTPAPLLKKLWNEPVEPVWGGLVAYLASRHPNADPSWQPEMLRRLDVREESSAWIRRSLARYEPLPGEVVDLLIRHAAPEFESAEEMDAFRQRVRDSGERYDPMEWGVDPAVLARRSDLSAAQMETLLTSHRWAATAALVARPDFPPHLFSQAARIDSHEAHEALLENPATPREVIEGILTRRVENPALHHQRGHFEPLISTLRHPLLPEKFHGRFANHAFPELRAPLAANPSLPSALLRKLAADPFSVVAGPARDQLRQRAEADDAAFLSSLPSLESLKPARTLGQEGVAALAEDDAKRFREVMEGFATVHYIGHDFSLMSRAVEAGAIRCIKDQVALGNYQAAGLARYAFGKGWTAAMSELVLETPDPETAGAFALAIAERGQAADLALLEERGISLKAATQPLVWTAVARRDADLLRRLLVLGASPDVRHEGQTPDALAAQIRFTEALRILPIGADVRAGLEAFTKRFPGDATAPWLGSWTNRKGEFQTLVLNFQADGTGSLITATGVGALTAWRRPDSTKAELILHVFDEQGREEATTMPARIAGEQLVLTLPDREEVFFRDDGGK